MPHLEKRNRVTSLWSAITRTNALGFDVDRFLKEGLKESGRRGSNPRRQAWEACILPLNYSRLRRRSVYIKRTGPTYRVSSFLICKVTDRRLTWNLMEMADWLYEEGVDSWGKTALDILTDHFGKLAFYR